MSHTGKCICLAITMLASFLAGQTVVAEDVAPKQQQVQGPHDLKITVRAQGPYDADVPLQVVCYFKHKSTGDTTKGAPVELDKRLGGVIAALRDRGEFTGDDQETLLLRSPAGTIKAQYLLLIGLGEESSLTLETMARVGRTAQREASRLGMTRVAFAPLLRDQGNSTLSIGEVETAVIRGMLLAYDTDLRLQKEGFSKSYRLTEWIVEAGPAFFDETIKGVEQAIQQAEQAVGARPAKAYSVR